MLPSLLTRALAFSFPFQIPFLSRHYRLPVPLHRLSCEQTLLVESCSQPTVCPPHKNPTKSFWTHGSPDANPLAKEGSEGDLTSDADIVIVGSGITGVGAAYHLSKLIQAAGNFSVDIVILEARDFCSGATGRNGGHLTPTAFHGFGSISDMYNIDEAIRWLALENHTTESIVSTLKSPDQDVGDEVDLVERDHLDLFFSHGEELLSRSHWEAARNAGVDLSGVHFLSKEETRATYGPAFPSVHFSGYNLWPLKAVTHFFKLAQEALVSSKGRSTIQLHTQTPVTSVRPVGAFSPNATGLPRRWVLETPRGNLHAHAVIHATNGYAAYLLPFLAAGSGHEGIVPTRGQIIATRANIGTKKVLKASYSANDGYEYWFPRPVNESNANPLIILGGGREIGGPDYEFGVTDDSVVNPAISRTLRDFLPTIYPDGWFERDRMPEMEWTGIMGYTKSHDPLVGPVVDAQQTTLKGQYIAAGYTGHGMPRAFGCAEALAGMVFASLQNKTWAPPAWFPDHFLTTSKWRSSGASRLSHEQLP